MFSGLFIYLFFSYVKPSEKKLNNFNKMFPEIYFFPNRFDGC